MIIWSWNKIVTVIAWGLACGAVLFFLLSACHHHSSSSSSQDEIITVSLKPLATTLYFASALQPLGGRVVTTPADGVIQDMNFHYGDVVKAGQILFTISSEKFFSDYKSAVMQYIKAKSDFSTNQSQLTQNEFLHKNELISDDTLKEKKMAFYNAQLSLLQAKDALSNLLKRLDLKGVNPYEIQIDDVHRITEAFQVQGDMQKLKIVAPVAGVALLPGRGDEMDSSKHLGNGSSVKQGDVLALVGDLSGFQLHISVNEFNVNQLKFGQKVVVTGMAFPEFILQGEIVGIDRQAQSSQGGVPMFPVDIVIKQLTPQEQSIIHVGMSAKVEINLEGEKQITLPLSAVYEKKGIAYVRVKEGKSGNIKEVAVKTGATTVGSVVIQEGLKAGDQVIVTS